jgi:pentatricopeptide repeat protein
VKKASPKKSSLLTKYSLQYEKKPKSRVFAPLAETYRKLGMHDEALKILRTGIRNHPNYTLGYIVLANVYYDKENFEIAYTTLRPFISKNLENITLQKLFSNICVNLGYLEEALNTFKCLLLINPKDEDVATQVKLLEDDLLIPDEDEVPKGYIEKRENVFDEDDDWVQVDFNRNNQREEDLKKPEDLIDSWEVKKIDDSVLDGFKSDVMTGKLEVSEHSLDDEYFHEEHDIEASEVISDEADVIENEPIITHTLVELYCKQGYFEKALELLDNILELHPDDIRTQKRKVEVQELLGQGKSDVESHGHSKLLDLVQGAENSFENDSILRKDLVVTKLNDFAKRLKQISIQKSELYQ